MFERQSQANVMMLTMAMTALYAVSDFKAPGEISVAIFYASSVVIAGWSRSYPFLWLTTTICLALTYIGIVLGPQPTAPVYGAMMVNRSLVAVGLIMLAVLVHERLRMLDRQAQQSKLLRQADLELRRLNSELGSRVSREVDRRIETEKALHQAQKMEAIGNLSSGIAHDFNNILTTIVGNLELLMSRLSPEDYRRRLADNALRGAARGTSLVKRLLSFARRHDLEPEVIDSEAAVREVIALARPLVNQAIELPLELHGDVWPCRADPAELQSALLNLVINARDAMPTSGRLAISARNVTLTTDAADLSGGEYVQFSVADTGSGMAPEVLTRMFEPFFTTKSADKGSGLGLAMVYGFAKQSGGAVRIESAVGRGTTVHLYLPRMKPHRTHPADTAVQ